MAKNITCNINLLLLNAATALSGTISTKKSSGPLSFCLDASEILDCTSLLFAYDSVNLAMVSSETPSPGFKIFTKTNPIEIAITVVNT